MAKLPQAGRSDIREPTPKTFTPLSSWDRFFEEVGTIRAANPRPLLFRGQADAKWKLQTTLERRLPDHSVEIAKYFHALSRVQTEFEAFSGRKYQRIQMPDVWHLVQQYDSFSLALSGGQVPGMEFLVDLRQHGFPSPLLDWTRSPYVASYFAFSAPNDSDERAIYVWQQPEMRAHGSDRPELTRVGPYLTAHKRHFVQQCDYTLCPTFAGTGPWTFAPHNDALQEQRSQNGPLWKFTVPSSQRVTVMRRLFEMNVTAFSLHGTDEALAEMLAAREIDLTADFI